jgi:hypothetical protein
MSGWAAFTILPHSYCSPGFIHPSRFVIASPYSSLQSAGEAFFGDNAAAFGSSAVLRVSEILQQLDG